MGQCGDTLMVIALLLAPLCKTEIPLGVKIQMLESWYREARWPSGRALDSGARGWGFDPHSGRRVVSLSKIHLHVPPKKYW